MNIPFKTNQLKIDMNTAMVDQKYDIFRIETSDKYFNRGAYILDAPLLCNNVCSVYFDSGKCFYVLMQKDTSNKTRLKNVLFNTEGGDKISISEQSASTLEQRAILSLLLNAISSYELEFLRFNNLTGHLYCFHPKWMKKSGKNNESRIMKIPCLELSITNELRLSIAVRTFTSELLKSKIAFKGRTFEQHPKYTLATNNTLRRRLHTDTDKCFILRQTKGDKTEIPFMDIQNIEKFECSKMGIVSSVLSQFNKKYEGICHLQFQSIDKYVVADCPRSLIKENKQAVQNLLLSQKIRLVDYICDNYSSKFCEDICNILKEKYGINAVIRKRLAKDQLNLCIIHNAQYYDGQNDPYKKTHEGYTLQHITLEDFTGNADAAISTVMHELLIKRDIEARCISLFDWRSLGIVDDISFGMHAIVNDEDRYFFMRIKPDGSFNFTEQKLDLFELNEYTDCVNIFSASKDVTGIIRYSDGNINVIRETTWFTIPEIETIHRELSAGNTYLRGKAPRQELLSAITDIKLFDQGKHRYYFVGIIGEGMRTNVSHAANIRMIQPYKNAELRFEELLPLMNVTFVRNGQLTVIPFPFKYLREYIRSLQP